METAQINPLQDTSQPSSQPNSLMFDLSFILYRFLSMAPVALFVGIAFMRTRRLFPLMIVHFLLDLMLGLTVFTMSLGN